MMKTARSSNIELLRVLCMLMLIVHHFLAHGELWMLPVCTNKIVVNVLLPAGKICFNCFVAISCWFLVKSDFKGSRYIKIWLEVLFYNVLFTIITIFLQSGDAIIAGKRALLGSFFPMIGNSHGYAAAYLAFYFMLPILKRLQYGLNKQQTLYILYFLGMTQVIMPILGQLISYKQAFQSEFLLFVFVYFGAYYVQNWPVKIIQSLSRQVIIFALIVIFIIAVNIATMYCGNQIFGFLQAINSDEFSLLNIVAGFLLFNIVRNIKMPCVAQINAVASTTFGILLFHDHNYFRTILWSYFKNLFFWQELNTLLFIMIVLLIACCVFIIGMLVDALRQLCMESWVLRLKPITRCAEFLDTIARKFLPAQE